MRDNLIKYHRNFITPNTRNSVKSSLGILMEKKRGSQMSNPKYNANESMTNIGETENSILKSVNNDETSA